LKLLVDTHTWLWWLFEPSRLGTQARALLADNSSVCYFSAASAWELAIKIQTGKLNLPRSLQDILQQLDAQNIRWLDVSRAHCLRLETLPFHHRDPFDRMLASQAATDGLGILSADSLFEFYGVQRLW
jgi:PIN domain nuclease of toxin-antitoxin system